MESHIFVAHLFEIQVSRKKAILVSAEEAVKHINPGDRVVMPLSCGLPQTLVEAMVADKDRLKNVEIVSGLQVEYKFVDQR